MDNPSELRVISFNVSASELATVEQIAGLRDRLNAIKEQPLDTFIEDLNRKRSSGRDGDYLEVDEQRANQEHKKHKASKASEIAASKKDPQYTVEYSNNTGSPLTGNELALLVFGPTKPLQVTTSKNGASVLITPDNPEYETAIQALRVSLLEDAPGQFNFLLEAAIRNDEFTILDNYFATLEQKQRNIQFEKEQQLINPLRQQRKWDAADEDAKRRKRYRNLILLGLAITAVIAVAATVVLAVFVPPIGAAILAALPAIVTSVTATIIGYVKSLSNDAILAAFLGSAVGVGGIIEMFLGYKKRSEVKKLRAEYQQEIERLESEAKDAEEKIEDVRVKRAEVQDIRNAIRDQREELVLSSDLGISILRNKPNAHFQRIILKGVISPINLQFLLSVVAKDFTVVEINHDNLTQPLDEVTQRFLNDLDGEVLINNYLRGGVVNIAKARELWGVNCLEELKRATIEKIENSFNLTEFSGEIKPELKAAVTQVIEQNRLFLRIFLPALSSPPPPITYLKTFQLNPKRWDNYITNLHSPELEEQYRKQLQQGVLADIKASSSMGVLLKSLDETRCRELLTACFSDQKMYPKESEAIKKAALVSRILHDFDELQYVRVSSSGTNLESLVYYAFHGGTVYGNPYTYSELKERLKGLAVSLSTAGKTQEAEKLDRILQQDLQEGLMQKYALSSPKIDISQLQEELRSNTELKGFDFTQVPQLDPEVRGLIEVTCNRNQMYVLIAKYEKDKRLSQEELANFLNLFKALKDQPLELKPFTLLSMLSSDVGTYSSWGAYATAKKNSFDCSELRDLREQDQAAFIKLLTYGFMMVNPSPEEAGKKAELINRLFGIEELFTKEKQNDPVVKGITDAIFWAMVPWDANTLYDLAKLKVKLGEVIGSYGSDPIIEKVREALERPVLGIKPGIPTA